MIRVIRGSQAGSRPGVWLRRALAGAAVLGLLIQSAGATESKEASGSPPGTIEFVGKNAIATANGTFHRWRFSRIEIDREHPERSVIEVEVDIESVDTGTGRRDRHLRSDDFFDIEKYPTAKVRVSEATLDGESESGDARYRAKFDVTIRDVSKTLEGHFDLVEGDPARVEGELTLNRVDFGVGKGHSRWNPMSVREEIPIRFTAELRDRD